MEKIIEFPKKETKVVDLRVAVTPAEKKNVIQYCKNRKVKISDLIRFALKQTYDLNF